MSGIRDIREYLAPRLERTEALIAASLRSDIRLLDETNRSLLSHSGKMIRPMISLLCSGAAGVPGEDSIRFAAATELLHNATLLHDDVVDGSPTRRGQPTVLSILGGPASVLIGDFWLVKCIGCILAADRYSEEVIRLFAGTLSDLAEGEMLQLQKSSECDTTEDDYLRIIYCKTASLFVTACRSAALSVGAPEAAMEALASYGRNLGLAFQIKDDILDYQGGEALGKPTGQDLREQKITLPLLCALASVPEEEARRIRKIVSGLSDHPEDLPTIFSFVREHDGIARASTRLDRYVEAAVRALDPLPDSKEKSYLSELAFFVGAREN